MKSKWSKVLKPENRLLRDESFEMAELIPFSPGYGVQRQIANEEEPEIEPPLSESLSISQEIMSYPTSFIKLFIKLSYIV